MNLSNEEREIGVGAEEIACLHPRGQPETAKVPKVRERAPEWLDLQALVRIGVAPAREYDVRDPALAVDGDVDGLAQVLMGEYSAGGIRIHGLPAHAGA